MEQERVVGGWFRVSVEAEADSEKSSETDDLTDTVSYADLARVVCEEMKTASQLLEHVAGRIARRILHDYPTLLNATVRLTKENPPMGLNCNGAGVEITIKR
ncbi:MAG: dihydroneopterin aldolase [Bacteroidaceae bacterium]|nr:dihydroneopterin aldolase [Bacteroidaceae bacterium]